MTNGRPRTAEVPRIEDFITAARSSAGPCKYVLFTTLEQRTTIERVHQGHAWKAYARWLNACGVQYDVVLLAKLIYTHYERAHNVDA